MSDYIPEETKVEILKCLPVKSLLRFRSVCNWWKELIDSPSFMQHHLAVQKPRIILEYEEPEFLVVDPQALPSLDALSWPIESNPKRFRLVGTLHGVVCLYDDDSHILLWNPSVRKLSILPQPYYNWEDYSHEFENIYSAFWMDPSNKEFKVILFKLVITNHKFGYADLYTSSEQDWKEVPLGQIRYCQPLVQNPAVVIGRMAYWVSYKFKVGEEGYGVVLLCFDFEQERFDMIETAPSIKHRGYFHYHPLPCNWQGSLSLVYLDLGKRCDIYTRRQGSWVHLVGITLPSYISQIKALVDVEEENCRVLASTSGELVVCDTKVCRIPVIVKRELEQPDYVRMAYDFVESLILP